LNAARSRQNRLSEPGLEEKGNDEGRCAVDGATVGHIQLVTSLVEGRWIGLSEILTMLGKILRQHSIDLAVKMSYGALCRQKNPP
jgi:hypothetical protein